MGKVIPFTQQNIKEAKLIGHRISFYSYGEIDIALLALNMYGFEQKRYTIEILKTLDPLYIKNCLLKLKNSDIISNSIVFLLASFCCIIFNNCTSDLALEITT